MNLPQLDSDTTAIIEAMMLHTGKTPEQAVLALVELGMLGMIASISEQDKKEKIISRIHNVVNNDSSLKKTAEIYSSAWQI